MCHRKFGRIEGAGAPARCACPRPALRRGGAAAGPGPERRTALSLAGSPGSGPLCTPEAGLGLSVSWRPVSSLCDSGTSAVWGLPSQALEPSYFRKTVYV